MDASLNQHLSFVSLALAAAAFCFSLIAAYPTLRGVVAAVRDGVLWFALFLVLGGVGFVVWQHLQEAARGSPSTNPRPAATSQGYSLSSLDRP